MVTNCKTGDSGPTRSSQSNLPGKKQWPGMELLCGMVAVLFRVDCTGH